MSTVVVGKTSTVVVFDRIEVDAILLKAAQDEAGTGYHDGSWSPVVKHDTKDQIDGIVVVLDTSK